MCVCAGTTSNVYVKTAPPPLLNWPGGNPAFIIAGLGELTGSCLSSAFTVGGERDLLHTASFSFLR